MLGARTRCLLLLAKLPAVPLLDQGCPSLRSSRGHNSVTRAKRTLTRASVQAQAAQAPPTPPQAATVACGWSFHFCDLWSPSSPRHLCSPETFIQQPRTQAQSPTLASSSSLPVSLPQSWPYSPWLPSKSGGPSLESTQRSSNTEELCFKAVGRYGGSHTTDQRREDGEFELALSTP